MVAVGTAGSKPVEHGCRMMYADFNSGLGFGVCRRSCFQVSGFEVY